VKPKKCAKGVKGNTTAIKTIETVVIVRGRLGLLLNGFPAVRITKIISVCVANDSTNQPV